MLNDTISRVYASHHRSLSRAARFAQDLQPDSIHQLRLNIKSLRGLLRLLEEVPVKKLKTETLLQLLSPVFKQAGKVRTATLNLDLLKDNPARILKKFKKSLLKKQAAEGEKLVKELRKLQIDKIKKLSRKNRKRIAKADNEELTEQSVRYLREQLADVRNDLFEINDDETLHAIRRKLRDIRNTARLLDEAKVEHPFTEEMKKVNATYEKIGRWHDTVDLISAIEKFLDSLHEPDGLEETVPLLVSLKKQSLRDKRQIARKLRSDLVRPA